MNTRNSHSHFVKTKVKVKLKLNLTFFFQRNISRIKKSHSRLKFFLYYKLCKNNILFQNQKIVNNFFICNSLKSMYKKQHALHF
jgi:hypothetical protein